MRKKFFYGLILAASVFLGSLSLSAAAANPEKNVYYPDGTIKQDSGVDVTPSALMDDNTTLTSATDLKWSTETHGDAVFTTTCKA
nr:hypothetical protein [Butyrivibrio sp.]